MGGWRHRYPVPVLSIFCHFTESVAEVFLHIIYVFGARPSGYTPTWLLCLPAGLESSVKVSLRAGVKTLIIKGVICERFTDLYYLHHSSGVLHVASLIEAYSRLIHALTSWRVCIQQVSKPGFLCFGGNEHGVAAPDPQSRMWNSASLGSLEIWHVASPLRYTLMKRNAAVIEVQMEAWILAAWHVRLQTSHQAENDRMTLYVPLSNSLF